MIDRLKMQVDIVDYIESIYVYSTKNDYVISDRSVMSINDFKDDTWYKNLTERIYEPGRIITRQKKGGSDTSIISYIQPIRLTQLEFLGGIIVNIDLTQLDELVISSGNKGVEKMLIVDRRNNIVYNSDEKDQLDKITKTSYHTLLASLNRNTYALTKSQQEEIILTAIPSKYFEWSYISVVPLSLYDEYQATFRRFYLILIILIVIISVIGAVFIAFYCYAPVMNILNLVKNPKLYEQRYKLDAAFSKNETQEIGLNIIRNIYSNTELKKEMSHYAETIDDAHLAALQAQISPHFLYNTLENIRWRVIERLQGDNEISEAILKLSEMLRISLDNNNQLIGVKEEIENAKLYIDILKLRYADKLEVNWNVDDQAYKYQIVKVSLQPIIENALYHGIKPSRKYGIIDLDVKVWSDNLVITVSDNGIGMSEDELKLLNDDMTHKYMLKKDHIGVRNVNQRLKLLLGDLASIKLKSRLGGVGTKVIISLPLKMKE